MTDVRKGQAPDTLARDEFRLRFVRAFDDPAYDAERDAIARLEAIAWDAYDEGRKAPRTHPAGAGYADPGYALSDEWRATKERLERAQAAWADPATPSRVLVVCGSPRNDGTCPGEVSKAWRLAGLAREALQAAGIETGLLDLSRMQSEYGLRSGSRRTASSSRRRCTGTRARARSS